MTPSGIEPATLRFVPQHLNHCATSVPHIYIRPNTENAIVCTVKVTHLRPKQQVELNPFKIEVKKRRERKRKKNKK
jgi:hypothetical protein